VFVFLLFHLRPPTLYLFIYLFLLLLNKCISADLHALRFISIWQSWLLFVRLRVSTWNAAWFCIVIISLLSPMIIIMRRDFFEIVCASGNVLRDKSNQTIAYSIICKHLLHSRKYSKLIYRYISLPAVINCYFNHALIRFRYYNC